MAKEARNCKCGAPAEKHESKSTETSSWRGKSLIEGSKCARYKWARPAKKSEPEQKKAEPLAA